MGHHRNLAVSLVDVMFLDVRMDNWRVKAGLFRLGCRDGGYQMFSLCTTCSRYNEEKQ